MPELAHFTQDALTRAFRRLARRPNKRWECLPWLPSKPAGARSKTYIIRMRSQRTLPLPRTRSQGGFTKWREQERGSLVRAHLTECHKHSDKAACAPLLKAP